MKIVLITDTHWGVRNDNQAFLDNNKRFIEQVFLPTLHEEKINVVVHLGDLVDRRKYINFHTANRLRQDFLIPLHETGIQLLWILGNHDIYWRNRMDISVAQELNLPHSVETFAKATELYFDGLKILFVPWVCDSNREQVEKRINNTDARVCFGHLELEGFEAFKGMISPHGENPDTYRKFELVCTGHFHHKSVRDNIHYLGASGQYIWNDFGDDRGFHIFDTGDLSLRFIQNPFNMFAKVFYDDANPLARSTTNFENVTGKIVKVIVKSRTNSDKYNDFIIQLEKAQPLEYATVDDHLNADLVSDDNLVSETKDTLTIIRDYVASTNNVVNAHALDTLIVDLYRQAQGIDND